MSWHPHPIAVALAVIMLIVAVWFGVQGRHTRGRTATTILDILLAVLVGLIGLHPVVGESGRQSSSVDADIVIMVDTTTSMAARDNGNKTRLSGAIRDIAQLASVFRGARFTLVTFDNEARVAVASTTDTGTIVSAANSLTWREDTKGTGTDIGVGVPTAVDALRKARESAPQATRMVFYLGDGEQTATKAPGSFAALKPLVTNGAVYGYGTAKGAPMARSAFDSNDVTYHGRKAISHADHTTLTSAARQAGLSFAARSPGRTLTPPQISLNRTTHEEQVNAGTDLAWILGLVAAADVAVQLTMSARQLRRARKDVL
ncbi:MAG: VWA domain-containing protein [Cutibacterium avidum]|uniref:von Willebrand factor type A domain protein n=1 Tax=Cutibacterium avidum ATCC 25577 TaxID=997355 RepID=G4CUQ8_9ACTN|nr:VWA domain-containing protein [Cutibacterium avidum]ERS24921.1 hypothetical protein HMPREF1301_00314 [Propionibacterium sp. KPL2005]ERS29213.1 hypothetical protein HMPREF1297_00023 [Propionibacterium sp. KPL2000]EGY78696.1 von Willebrand factor type A domain protein [Cutibacterium avidum ATCC 25577]MCG7371005.1 VWA domain-containing protein [Cutibacterium avidum]MDU4922268.1 VWA domain-containing protein [Cutibacterium avidum]